MAILKPQTPLTPEQQLQRRRNLGVGLAALSETLRGGDPVARTLGLQQQFEQQEAQRLAEEQRLAKEQRLQQFAQTNPQLARMYELFGEQGLQQGYLSQLEAQKSENARLNAIQTYINAGVKAEDASLLAAGLSIEDIKSLRSEETTSQDIINNVNKEVKEIAKQTNYPDVYSNLDEAFGPQDAIQENLLNIPARILFGADPAGETGAAIRARNSLNLEIKAILANDYTGRPSNLLLQEIEKVLPTNTATSEKDAYEKYLNLLQRTRSRAQNLEQGIQSEITSDADKEKYREQLFKTRELEKKLDAAVMSLKSQKKEDILEPLKDFGFDGKYSRLYLNNG